MKSVFIEGHEPLPLLNLIGVYKVQDPPSYEYGYLYAQGNWHLVSYNRKDLAPFAIHFSKGVYSDIFKKSKSTKDPLIKALGKDFREKRVLDLTAGWLKDSWRFLVHGISVTAFENQPLVYNFLNLSLQAQMRNLQDQNLLNCLKLLNLKSEDSKEFLKTHTLSHYDVIYLDPMFPEKRKSALASKEMQILQDIVGETQVGEDLLEVALNTQASRVIVKRPLHASPLANPVTFQSTSKSSRFDVYVKSS